MSFLCCWALFTLAMFDKKFIYGRFESGGKNVRKIESERDDKAKSLPVKLWDFLKFEDFSFIQTAPSLCQLSFFNFKIQNISLILGETKRSSLGSFTSFQSIPSTHSLASSCTSLVRSENWMPLRDFYPTLVCIALKANTCTCAREI
jgi:hypothetical protein